MRKIFLLLGCLAFILLSCRLGLPKSQLPGPPISISTEEAKRFEEKKTLASEDLSNTGRAELQISETEITSYFYYELQSQNQTTISQPQIYFRDGKIQLIAQYSEGKIPVDLKIILSPIIVYGKLELELEGMRLGPAAAPDLLVQQAQRIIDEQVEPGFNQNLVKEFNVESFSIADGMLSISGIKP